MSSHLELVRATSCDTVRLLRRLMIAPFFTGTDFFSPLLTCASVAVVGMRPARCREYAIVVDPTTAAHLHLQVGRVSETSAHALFFTPAPTPAGTCEERLV